MAREPQHRGEGAYVEDLWFRKDGAPKARNGVGKRWRVVTVAPDGGRETESFVRKGDAERHRDAINAALLSGSYVTEAAGRVTAAELYQQYLSHQLDGATKARRESAWATWVQPKWSRTQVRRVTRSGVKAWIVELGKQGAKPETVESAMDVLRGILQVAQDDKRVVENVARGHKLPARTASHRHYLTHQQVWQPAEVIDQRYRTLVLLLVYSGMRFGEAAALTVGDLDLLRRVVRIRQQVSEVRGRLNQTPTKGKRRRELLIPQFLVEPLSIACQGKKWSDQIFAAPKGGTLRLNSWRTRQWASAVEALTEADDSDFPPATPHDLRHTAASLAVSAGANVLAVQRMLGHQSAVLTPTPTATCYRKAWSPSQRVSTPP